MQIRSGSCKESVNFAIAISKELGTNTTNDASSITFRWNISCSFRSFLHLFDLNIIARFIVIIITNSIHLNSHSLYTD